jgi:hypothetical protein
MPYYLAMLFILVVSGVDSWFCFQISPDELKSLEVNPICKQLLDVGGADLLVSSKVVGTAIVAAALQELKFKKYKHLWLVIWSLILVQSTVMLSYLVLFLELM